VAEVRCGRGVVTGKKQMYISMCQMWERRSIIGFSLVLLFTSRSRCSGHRGPSGAWHREYTFVCFSSFCVFTRAFTWSSHNISLDTINIGGIIV
jgi:hypothetical protein